MAQRCQGDGQRDITSQLGPTVDTGASYIKDPLECKYLYEDASNPANELQGVILRKSLTVCCNSNLS